MPTHDIILIGASASDVEALRSLTRLLPSDLRAAVFIVLQFPPYGVSHLPKILSRSSALPAAHAVNEERVQLGRLYIAPPGQHLALRPGKVDLSFGPKENRARPAIDVLFRTAAQSYGERVVAVVLSGALGDAASGLIEVKKQGGITIYQDPEETGLTLIPQSADLSNHLQHVLPVAEIASLLTRLAREAVPEQGTDPVPDSKQLQQEKIDRDLAEQAQGKRPDQPALYTCPDCGGNLWEVNEQGAMRFQCHVGHTLSGDELLVGKSEETERYLWAALRSTKERANLLRQMAERARQQTIPMAASNFEERMADRLEVQAREADEEERQIKQVLEGIK